MVGEQRPRVVARVKHGRRHHLVVGCRATRDRERRRGGHCRPARRQGEVRDPFRSTLTYGAKGCNVRALYPPNRCHGVVGCSSGLRRHFGNRVEAAPNIRILPLTAGRVPSTTSVHVSLPSRRTQRLTLVPGASSCSVFVTSSGPITARSLM